ncbi:MAG: hypothetical protein O2803_13330 [Chloroflexi bacterium]|nr:hypothetical protein [Chloroflexota bacterium]
MAGPKQTYEVELTTDQMAFMRSMKERYEIADDSKAFRIVIDYLMVTQDAHDTVFAQNRCLRCD